jgi:PAS domain S-box-containing protein
MQEAFTVQELVYDSSGRSENYVILDVNPMFEEVMGLDREEVVGRLATEAFQVERPPYLGRYSKVASTGKPIQFEAYYEPTDRYFQVSVFRPAQDQFATVFNDISDRKRMEQEVRESQRQLKTLMDNLPGMAYRCLNHPDWPMEFVSLGCLALTGFSPDDLLQEGQVKYGDLIHPDDRQTVWDEVQKALQRNRVFRLLYRIYTADDQLKWVWEQGQGVYASDDQVLAIEGFITDITERMSAEQAVRRSEERYRTLTETTPDIIIMHEPGGLISYINQAGCDYIGLSREEIYKCKTDDFIPIEYQDEIMERKARRTGGNTGTFQYEMELMNKRGERLPVDVRSTPIVQKGEVIGILVVARDITERKLAEEALRRSQNLLSRSQAIAQVGSWELDLRTNELIWSDEVYRLFGLAPAKFGATYEAFMDCLHPDDRETVDQAFTQSLVEGGDPYEIEHRIVRKDSGETRVVLEKCDHIKDEHGEVVSSIGMVQDITERKIAQQALEDSERRFREVVAKATDGIVINDSQGIIIEWNNRQTEITGLTREAVIGKHIWEIQEEMAFEGEGPPEMEENREEVIRNIIGSPDSEFFGTTIERRIKHTEGTVRIVETALYPIRSEDQAMIVSVVHDITERKHSEEERERLTRHIRDQASVLEQILATVPAGVVLVDGKGIIRQANPVAEKDLGTLANAKVGDRLSRLGSRPLYEVLNPPPEGLWHEIEAGEQVFEVIARPMQEGSEEGYWVLVINDVTRDREIRKQLQQQGQLAAVGQLAAGIAHDFNNIIAIIGLYAELGLNTPNLDRKVAERFEMIEQQTDRAARLTQQIMDFSRSSALKRYPIDLSEFFDEFGKLIEQTIPSNIRIELNNQIDSCTVNADPARLQQALLNLVLNARDAMRTVTHGTLTMELSAIQLTEPISCIVCGLISSGDWIRIQVGDNGSGIEPDILTHIFEPFFTTKDVGKGTGLGLAQVFGIVKQHDGHIDVESEVGSGTKFMVYLPRTSIDPVVLESQESGRIFGRGEKLLVVEDSPVLRRALRETLELLNYMVLEAENGAHALQILDSDPHIALVLSDLVMPEMGGQRMFMEMQQRQIATPVIMLSGHPMESEIARLELEGLAGWLLKPPTPDQLAGQIAQALRSHRSSADE